MLIPLQIVKKFVYLQYRSFERISDLDPRRGG